MKQLVMIDATPEEIKALEQYCRDNNIFINLKPDRYDIEDVTGFDWDDSGC